MRNLCQFCANWKGERCRMWSAKQFECFWMYSFNLRLSYKYGNSFEHLKAFCALIIYVQVPRHYLMQNILLMLCHIQSQSHCVGRWTCWRHLGANVLPSSCMPHAQLLDTPSRLQKCCRFAFGSGSARRQTCLPFVYNNSNSNRVKRQQQQQQC